MWKVKSHSRVSVCVCVCGFENASVIKFYIVRRFHQKKHLTPMSGIEIATACCRSSPPLLARGEEGYIRSGRNVVGVGRPRIKIRLQEVTEDELEQSSNSIKTLPYRTRRRWPDGVMAFPVIFTSVRGEEGDRKFGRCGAVQLSQTLSGTQTQGCGCSFVCVILFVLEAWFHGVERGSWCCVARYFYSSVCKCVFVVQLGPVYLEQQVERLFGCHVCFCFCKMVD